ncbi:MAG: hypothetical protein AAF732_16415 [Pseudomonadota bacterium]
MLGHMVIFRAAMVSSGKSYTERGTRVSGQRMVSNVEAARVLNFDAVGRPDYSQTGAAPEAHDQSVGSDVT